MSLDRVQFKLKNIQGYLSIVAYIHHFEPGSLKIQTKISGIHIDVLKHFIEESGFDRNVFKTSRRWLQKGEMPYPGYCRAPGSAVCQPVLCNCDKLTEIWESLNNISH